MMADTSKKVVEVTSEEEFQIADFRLKIDLPNDRPGFLQIESVLVSASLRLCVLSVSALKFAPLVIRRFNAEALRTQRRRIGFQLRQWLMSSF
jgi:hypothetical protein